MAELKANCRAWLWSELPADAELLDAVLAWCTEYPDMAGHVQHLAVVVVVNEFERFLRSGVASGLLNRWQ